MVAADSGNSRLHTPFGLCADTDPGSTDQPAGVGGAVSTVHRAASGRLVEVHPDSD